MSDAAVKPNHKKRDRAAQKIADRFEESVEICRGMGFNPHRAYHTKDQARRKSARSNKVKPMTARELARDWRPLPVGFKFGGYHG